ncbi:Carboxylesterase [Trichoderma velutinum]
MAIGSTEKLPVLVWIHGGGFTYGDATYGYDGNWIVEHSISIGRPIIVVTLQYRLGYYGFLSSKELQAEARASGEAGFANVGLHDQRLGLQWVQQNIHFFGGDASAVTLSGESAGAWSVVAHMRSNYPGFQRAFVLSDAAIPLLTPEQSQENFDSLVSTTGLPKSAPAADKIAALRDLSQADFAKLLERGAQRPGWDDVWFTEPDLSSGLEDGRAFPNWLEALVIGSAKHECALWDPLWRRLNDAACVKLAEQSVAGISSGGTILQEYGIKSNPAEDKSHDHKAIEGLVRLATDSLFGCIPYTIASRHSELPISMYRFDQTDDDPRSPAQGSAYHSMSNPFFFNFPTVSGPEAPEKARETSRGLITAAIALAYGEQPWEPFSKDRKMMVFGGDEPGLRDLRSEDLRFLKFCASAEDYRAFTGAGGKLISELVYAVKTQGS